MRRTIRGKKLPAACRSSLADFKVPREIRFVDEMPRSTLEKVAKAELRKLLGSAAARPSHQQDPKATGRKA
jgi:acyl-coenzyme A synthetase/AMP-(fatty) acid ligase